MCRNNVGLSTINGENNDTDFSGFKTSNEKEEKSEFILLGYSNICWPYCSIVHVSHYLLRF